MSRVLASGRAGALHDASGSYQPRNSPSDGVDGPTTASMCQDVVVEDHDQEPPVTKVSTIGLDLAKHVFQVHGADERGAVIIQRRLRRGEMIKYLARLEPTIVGMEACSMSHYLARELRALGHEVRLMPAQYVKAYVKRLKNDAADAAGIVGYRPNGASQGQRAVEMPLRSTAPADRH